MTCLLAPSPNATDSSPDMSLNDKTNQAACLDPKIPGCQAPGFQKAAQQTLDQMMDRLDTLGMLYHDTPESLAIQTSQGIYLINIHQTLTQLWLSSPLSGAHHFTWTGTTWQSTRQHQTLGDILKAEQGWDLVDKA